MDPKRDTSKSPFTKRQTSRLSVPEILGYLLAVVWVLFSLFLILSDRLNSDSALLNQLLVMFMPFAMICLSLIIMRTSRVMQEETRLLQTAIDALRKTYMDQQKLNGQTNPEAFVLRRLDEISSTQRKMQTALTMLNTERVTQRERQISGPQKTNHPDEKDSQKSLELKDRETAILIQAAQDVLTLLSQDGIYMDDLRPDMARPDAWRQFAQGERGRKIAALGGIRDRSSLALTNGRMKQDTIFRDTAHHFLRQFDKVFSKFEKRATDADLSAFSDTRSARAFMLVGRVAGTFD
ncbi:MAG: hypothetical protein EBW38_05250 [Rhodobacteraceae bacterium]|nr:hypothetical protein [Paracoccaceae bacterium]